MIKRLYNKYMWLQYSTMYYMIKVDYYHYKIHTEKIFTLTKWLILRELVKYKK